MREATVETIRDAVGPTASADPFLDDAFDVALDMIQSGIPLRRASNRIPTDQQEAHEEVLSLARQVSASGLPDHPRVRGYEILFELGRGGVGVVYLARQERVGGRLVALKVLPAGSTSTRRARERFRREIEIMGAVRHASIVSIHDVVRDGEVLAFAMEWIEGITLAQAVTLVRAQPGIPNVRALVSILPRIPPEVARASYAVFMARIGLAMARALVATHQAGVVHRDVKPSNILLRMDGTPVLADFGLVHGDSDGMTRSEAVVGTPAYAAPEQLRGRHDLIDVRTDVYGLGATLFEALALERPHPFRHPIEILESIEQGAVPDLRRGRRWIPADLATIVGKAIDPDPARRYPSASELADDLERLLNLEPVRARPAGPIARMRRYVRRNRVSVLAGTLAWTVASTAAIAIVLNLFLLPRWTAEHVAAARLELLSPYQAYLLFTAKNVPDELRSARRMMRKGTLERLDAALEHYDRAIAFSFGRHPRDVELEREAVRLARGLWTEQATSTAAVPTDARALPATTAYFATWSIEAPRGGSARHSAAHSEEDARCLGLVAFLVGDPDTCNSAWRGIEKLQFESPLVSGALGQLYLRSGNAVKALHRLEAAAEAFQDASFLWTDVGEAARLCGDFELAEKAADAAERSPRPEPFGELAHLRANLAAAAGRDDEARERFERLRQEHADPRIRLDYADFLERQADWRRLAAILGEVLQHREKFGYQTEDLELRRRFVCACQRASEPGFGASMRPFETRPGQTLLGEFRRFYVQSVGILRCAEQPSSGSSVHPRTPSGSSSATTCTEPEARRS